MITNTGKTIIAKYLLGQAPAYASYLAIGCGATPLTTGDPLGNYSTKQNLEEVGSQLLFDRRGVLVNTLPAVRSVGTTVNIEHLFLNLPVRRQEFLR